MDNRVILLVEDNPDDVALTLRALKKNHILNPVVTARDGVEALDYLFCTGVHAGRDPAVQPAVTLLDLKLPRIDSDADARRAAGEVMEALGNGEITPKEAELLLRAVASY